MPLARYARESRGCCASCVLKGSWKRSPTGSGYATRRPGRPRLGSKRRCSKGGTVYHAASIQSPAVVYLGSADRSPGGWAVCRGQPASGVSGAYLQVANFFHDRPRAEMWRVWFFVGMLCGSFVAGLLQGGLTLSLAYGALGVVLPLALLVSVLTLAASARIAGAILSEVGRNDATGPLQYLCWARGRSRVRTPGRNTARARHAAPRAG